MLGITHALYGIVVGIWLQHLFSLRVELAVLFAVLGSLLPDIDEPHSFVGRHFKVIGWMSKHRGAWHSIVVMTLLVIGLELIFAGAGYALGAGFLSHLVLDGVTRGGVKPFWPSKLKLRGWMKTGGLGEWAFRVVGVVLLVFMLL